MKDFDQLKKNLKKDYSGLSKLKVALLGDSSTQLLVQAVRGYAYDLGYDLDIWESGHDQIDLQLFSVSSEFKRNDYDIVVVFRSSHKLLQKFNRSSEHDRQKMADEQIALIKDSAKAAGGKLIYFNFQELDDSVYGSYSNKVPSSFIYQIRKLNYEMMRTASEIRNLYICDISSVQNEVGKAAVFSPALYVNSGMVLSLSSLPIIAKRLTDIIAAISGKVNKCLVLDLDNTLWGGVIGDDGIENIQLGELGIGKAFTEFQLWIKKLKDRGIILAICSKNDVSTAKEPFEKHPDMILGLKDISVFVANWENKVDNLRKIKNTLNIGFDSMVFIDDSPFERNMVRENIPEICVPEMPEDPSEYLEFLYSLNLFETVSVSSEDKERAEMYRMEEVRNDQKSQFMDENEFLKSLNMVSAVEPFTPFNYPRLAQLSQRSNQFNLRTVRYCEEDIKRFAVSDSYMTFSFGLKDKFGDSGLISMVVLEKAGKDRLFIDTWIMSCRVLNRGMEHFVLNTIVDNARKYGFRKITGEYLPTTKNGMVKDLYKKLGFTMNGDKWELDVGSYLPYECHINMSVAEHTAAGESK